MCGMCLDGGDARFFFNEGVLGFLLERFLSLFWVRTPFCSMDFQIIAKDSLNRINRVNLF
jgi:hypothetical protein